MDISFYADLVTSQHRDKPKFIAWLTALVTPIVDTTNAILLPAFDIDNAVGKQLDTIGAIYGLTRQAYDLNGTLIEIPLDDDFRVYIQCQIAIAFFDGTFEYIQAYWERIFPENVILYTDVPKTLVDPPTLEYISNIFYIGGWSTKVSDLFNAGLLTPKIAGVLCTTTQSDTYLTYDTVKAYDRSYYL